MNRIALLGIALGLLGCGSSDSTGGTVGSESGPPSGPVAGQVNNLSISVASSLGLWVLGGRQFLITLTSYEQTCSRNTFPTLNSTEIGITIPPAKLTAGTYSVNGMGNIDSTDVGVSASTHASTADGGVANWSDLLSQGTVWLTSVTDSVVSGSLDASDSLRGVHVAGTFTASVCATTDGGP